MSYLLVLQCGRCTSEIARVALETGLAHSPGVLSVAAVDTMTKSHWVGRAYFISHFHSTAHH